MKIEIKKMTSKYAEEISIMGKGAKELQIDSKKQMYYSPDTIKMLLKSKAGICLVALVDNKLAGFAIRIYHEYFNELYLSDLFVKKEYRKLGIGKALFQESAKIARSMGVKWAWALVQDTNKNMQRFLKKNGFKKGKKFNYYYNNQI